MPTKVIVTPDIFIRERLPSDDFILSASDGLWDFAKSEEVANAVYSLMPKLKSASAVAKEIAGMAKKDGKYKDDTTVVLLILRPWWDVPEVMPTSE